MQGPVGEVGKEDDAHGHGWEALHQKQPTPAAQPQHPVQRQQRCAC